MNTFRCNSFSDNIFFCIYHTQIFRTKVGPELKPYGKLHYSSLLYLYPTRCVCPAYVRVCPSVRVPGVRAQCALIVFDILLSGLRIYGGSVQCSIGSSRESPQAAIRTNPTRSDLCAVSTQTRYG